MQDPLAEAALRTILTGLDWTEADLGPPGTWLGWETRPYPPQVARQIVSPPRLTPEELQHRRAMREAAENEADLRNMEIHRGITGNLPGYCLWTWDSVGPPDTWEAWWQETMSRK